MNGLEALVHIRKTHPRLPIIMFSTLTTQGGAATLDALSQGATDYVAKPANVGSVQIAIERVRDELIPEGARARRHSRGPRRTVDAGGRVPRRHPPRGLPAPTAPIELVDDRRLDRRPERAGRAHPRAAGRLRRARSDRPAHAAAVHAAPRRAARPPSRPPGRGGDVGRRRSWPNTVYIAPGDFHMRVDGKLAARHIVHQPGPARELVPPRRRRAVPLGRVGVRRPVPRRRAHRHGQGRAPGRGGPLRRGRPRCIAQDEATSVVWGMPGFVARAGSASAVVPLRHIAAEIVAPRRSVGRGIETRPAVRASTG